MPKTILENPVPSGWKECIVNLTVVDIIMHNKGAGTIDKEETLYAKIY
jgi:hypothetical protein